VGVLTEPSLVALSPSRCRDRRGLALPSAMFALIAIAVLVGGVFVFADLSARSVRNRERGTRAVHVAEAGINHALGLLRGSLRMHSFTRILRGSDNLIATAPQRADDSLFINWGLTAGDQIPLAGQAYQGHTYFVTIADDPADTDGDPKADMNGRVRIWCRAVTTAGATAQVEAIVGAVPMPGVTVDGNLAFSGTSAVVTGDCGGAHANGNVTSGGPGPTIGTQVSATGTVSGNYRRPDGSAAPELNAQDEVVVPDLNPMNFCAGADFTLTNSGGVLNMATNVLAMAPFGGWTWDPTTQTWNGVGAGGLPAAGTYCVQGNVWLNGATGTGAAPKEISILATGSIRVEGTPYLIPDHPDGILLMAQGDIYLAGNNTAGAINYNGMVYAGAQCSAQGNVTMFGQLVCANGAQPVGAIDWAPGNTVGGNFVLNFDCSGNVFNKRRILYWYPRIGT
jgi:hypothetical protein